MNVAMTLFIGRWGTRARMQLAEQSNQDRERIDERELVNHPFSPRELPARAERCLGIGAGGR